MKFSTFSFSHASTNHLQLWTSPTRSQLASNYKNNLPSDRPIIPSLASNHPLTSHVLPHFNFSLSTKRDKEFRCGVIPQGSLPLPPDPPSDHWKSWLVGILITALLPLLKNKLGSLLKLKNEVETAIETVDQVMEVGEKLAEDVEKVAELVAEQTPAGSKLHEAAASVENVAKEAAKEAHLADDVLDKVEEVVKELEESLVEPMVDEANNRADKPNA